MKVIASDSINIPHKIIHSAWFCDHETLFRRVDIYAPQTDEPLPVLYLIHGINGYEGSWQEKGHAIDTLEALIASGMCQPMIIVMPDCNKWPYKPHPGHGNLWKSIWRYPRISREHEIELSISELMDWIDTTYCVSYCMIAGLSDGARIAANVANLRPDCIEKVGLFSPVLHKDQTPKHATQTFYIYVGKNDIFYTNGSRFHKRLNKTGCKHEKIVMKGNHNWKMWRNCLSDFLKKINSSEACE